MTTTIDTIGTHLDGCGFKHKLISSTRLTLMFHTDHYRNRDDDASLGLVVEVANDGRFVLIVAPRAFQIEGEHRAAAIETCLRFQWTYRLVRLEFDHRDGELRLSVNLPVFDGDLTRAQLGAAIGMMVELCDELYPALTAVLRTGEMPVFGGGAQGGRVAAVAERLATLTPEQLDLLLAAVTDSEPNDEPHAPAGSVA